MAKSYLETICIGFDTRPAEVQAYAIARNTIKRHLTLQCHIQPLIMSQLVAAGLYKRDTGIVDGRLFDRISNAPMSTQFALTRFLIPHIVQDGYALFVDCDVMARVNISLIMKEIDPDKAVSVVKHRYNVTETTKMDGQIQTSYERKNWSSVVVWNVRHPANDRLTLERINTERGLWLHQFSWLDDNEIGELDPKWNFIVGHSDKSIDPALVHFSDGVPSMAGYETCDYADEWFEELRKWAK